MKKLLLISIAFIWLTGCKKDEATQKIAQGCNVNIALFKDVTWHHVTGALANITFTSSGEYYENGTMDGNWSQSNGCDSIFISRPSNSFYYQIVSVSTDSLHLRNSVWGEVTFYK